jgi:hypothetical protein
MEIPNSPPKWYETWKMVLGLWPEWKPTPATIHWLTERWNALHQDKLQDAIKQHRMEASAEKAGRPVYNRIQELYVERTMPMQQQRKVQAIIKTAQPLSPEDARAWDKWAASIMATVTPAEIRAAQDRLGITLTNERILATAIDYCRKTPPIPAKSK